MSRNFSAGTAITLVGAGARGFILYRAFQQLRRRAVDPDMKDPGTKLTRWLSWIPLGSVAVVAAIGVAAVWAWGIFGVLLTIACALVVVVVATVVAAYLWLAAEDYRRKAGYIICEADYDSAPRQIKSTMRRIYRSARTVRTGRAHQDGMFGELELERLVFTAAQQAVLSSDVSAGIRDLKPDAGPADRELIADADAQIKEIADHLVEVEARLKRTASTASRLSETVAEPERRREAQKAADEAPAAAEDRRRRAHEKLQRATAEAKVKTPVDATDVEDRVAAVAAGYEEVARISKQALEGGSSRGENSVEGNAVAGADDGGKAARTAAINAAKTSAGQATKLASAAGRAGAKKLKKLLDDQ
ncbi:hypothetical protein MMAG44476_34781 [Mycolicibacterium mageritense DSM 44476 = CIP 104973]|uniref:Uncharacterized protein n=1 Tax=Mycolicibacterium mageritense TaxID=53462 RepID=A0ABM7HW68_MYCME|nr:hypothetical protein [Mycolicibacterium mageritense]BBX34854.1 hypothetical protein MMAGJ_41360 [Mycolicibacterium mageritense]